MDERIAIVVVDGQFSNYFVSSDPVFQGTTWGLPLWNHYFADARFSVEDVGFEASVFADDLKAFRSFPHGANRECIHTELKQCQEKLHTWGKANQVSFDSTKENFKIIHQTKHEGVPFRLLGVLFGNQLNMERMASEFATQTHARISMILRRRRFYAKELLLRFYKSFVMLYLEFAT